MQIQKITWQATLPIRHHVLWPNKTPDFCRVQGDEKAYHFGGFIDAQLIGVISLYYDSAHTQNSATPNTNKPKYFGAMHEKVPLGFIKSLALRL